MIIKLEGVSHRQLANLSVFLESNQNEVKDATSSLAASCLKEAKDAGSGKFNLTLDVRDQVVMAREWATPESSRQVAIQGYVPRKFVNGLFDALGIFPEADEPVRLK